MTTENSGLFFRLRSFSLSYRLPTTNWMFWSSILPSARTGSVFLLTLSVTNRISSCSMTSSIESKSSYGPVITHNSSSRKVILVQQTLDFRNALAIFERLHQVPHRHFKIQPARRFEHVLVDE